METVKKFFARERFDFERPDIDLDVFFPHLRILLALNGVFSNKRNSLLRFVWPFIGTSCAIAATVLEGISTWHYLSIQDNIHATVCFCYMVIAIGVPLVTISVTFNNNNIHNLLEGMNKDFLLICSLGSKYRQPFLKGQLRIWHLYTAWFIFALTAGLIDAFLPVILLSYQTLIVTQDEHTRRPLQFPVWLPDDGVYKTPIYELILSLESFMSIYFVQTFSVYVYIMFHILLHYNTILDMIVLKLEVIFDGLEETVAKLPRSHERRVEAQLLLNRRIGRIVNMHLSVFRGVRSAASVFRLPLMYEILVSSIVICILAHQIATKLGEGIVDFPLILLCSAAIMGLCIPCYLGTLVRNKGFAIGDACWNCGWQSTSLGVLVRSDLIIIILQAQRPITIRYTGVPKVELETFSSEMSKAYSYFNMLRQYST